MRSRLRFGGSKAPFAVGVLIGVPLYFAALMASSLALDRPTIIGNHEFPTSGSREALIWAAALIAPGILVAAGLAGTLLARRVGVYLPAAAGIVVCLLLPGISQPWVARHTARFPLGMDFIADSSPSNLSSRGQWEKEAQATITSITHWTLGLAIGTVVVGILLEVRRRRGGTALLVQGPPADLDTGGAPQITG